MFSNPISEPEFINEMLGRQATYMTSALSMIDAGVPAFIPIFEFVYHPNHLRVQALDRKQLKKSLERFLRFPSEGKLTIYRLASGMDDNLITLATEFETLEIHWAKSRSGEYVIVRTSDRQSVDAGNFWLGYHGHNNLPTGKPHGIV